jgi:very-short-patch-repair endonuclease
MIHSEKIPNLIKKISHKGYETWVITGILHKLGDADIQFHMQQYADRINDNKYALIDLYFPQFKLAVEVDEPYHLNQLTADQIRQSEIQKTCGIKYVERVNCSLGMHHINNRIDEIVNKIKQLKQEQISEGVFIPFDNTDGYKHYRKIGYFSTEDTTELTNPTEICNCFGLKNPNQDGHRVWRNPKTLETLQIVNQKENYEDANGIVKGNWYNKVIDDPELGTVIFEGRITSIDASIKHCIFSEKNKDIKRLIFYKKRSALRDEYYTFSGVFVFHDYVDYEINGQIYKVCRWKKIADTFELPTVTDYITVLTENNKTITALNSACTNILDVDKEIELTDILHRIVRSIK